MFDLEQINSNTNIGQLDFHQTLGSTNDRAIELAKLGTLCCPALILTQNQTAGRGQRQHKWWSNQGSLTFSYVLKTEKPPLPILSANIALVVAQSIEAQTQLRGIKIKWPNDVLISNCKLAGILIETIPVERSWFVIIGVGINVNNELDNDLVASLEDREAIDSTLDPETKTSLPPTSVQIETRQTINKNDLMIELINRIESLSNALEQTNERINKRLAYRGQEIQVKEVSGALHSGVCEGIGANGELIIQSANGTQKIFSGTIVAD